VAGLTAAGGALFAAWVAWSAVRDQTEFEMARDTAAKEDRARGRVRRAKMEIEGLRPTVQQIDKFLADFKDPGRLRTGTMLTISAPLRPRENWLSSRSLCRRLSPGRRRTSRAECACSQEAIAERETIIRDDQKDLIEGQSVFGTVAFPIAWLASNFANHVDELSKGFIDNYRRTENPNCTLHLVELGIVLCADQRILIVLQNIVMDAPFIELISINDNCNSNSPIRIESLICTSPRFGC
jgi:hypothetical protein